MSESASESATDEVEISEKHPLWARWFHWVNFPLLTLMIWSGAMIYWANAIYWPFISRDTYHKLGLDYRLADGLSMHFAFMWPFIINGLLYVAFLIVTGAWREMIPRRDSWRLFWTVLLVELKLSKKELPHEKFNPAQRIVYTSIVLMGAASVLTGVVIYKPVQLAWLKTFVGGYEGARLIHYLLAVGFILFFFVHVAQVIRAGWNNFRAMVTGYEERR